MFRYKKKLYYITNSYLSIFRLSLEGILCLKRVPSLLYLVVKSFLMMTSSSLILVASSQCWLSCVAGMITHDHKHIKLRAHIFFGIIYGSIPVYCRCALCCMVLHLVKRWNLLKLDSYEFRLKR